MSRKRNCSMNQNVKTEVPKNFIQVRCHCTGRVETRITRDHHNINHHSANNIHAISWLPPLAAHNDDDHKVHRDHELHALVHATLATLVEEQDSNSNSNNNDSSVHPQQCLGQHPHAATTVACTEANDQAAPTNVAGSVQNLLRGCQARPALEREESVVVV